MHRSIEDTWSCLISHVLDSDFKPNLARPLIRGLHDTGPESLSRDVPQERLETEVEGGGKDLVSVLGASQQCLVSA